MWRSTIAGAVELALLAELVTSQSTTIDPTEDPLMSLSAFSALPRCAASGLSWGVSKVGSSSCQDSDDLTIDAACVCSSSEDLVSAVTGDVKLSCGSSDEAYIESATQVLDYYCDSKLSVDFVTTYNSAADWGPWEIDELGYYASCVYYGIDAGYSGNDELSTLCPTSTGLKRECMCSRTNVISAISSGVSSYVSSYCSNGDDVSSAYDVLDFYCSGVLGSSSVEFPTPTGRAGDMTYYITHMPQFHSLFGCAQLGIEDAVEEKSTYYCPTGAQALASCACFKPVMSASMTSLLASYVESRCSDQTPEDRVSEALQVFGDYCSAAAGKKTIDSITQSVTESFPLARPTGVVTGGPTNTGTPVSCDEDETQDKCNGGSSGVNKKAVIAGSVVGGVAFIALVIVIAWFLRRKRRQARQDVSTQGYTDPNDSSYVTNDAHKSWQSQGGVLPEYDGRPVSEMPSEAQPSELYVAREEWGRQQHEQQQQQHHLLYPQRF